MEENQESPNVIERLALVTDAMQTIFPNGKMVCIYELNEVNFKEVQTNFRKIDYQNNRFTINISGLEHVFILENTINEQVQNKVTVNVKKTFKEKLFSFFKGSSGSI